MCRVNGHGHETSFDFVFALCPRLKNFFSRLDGVFDEPVITKLEMDGVVGGGAAPVPTVKRVSLSKAMLTA